MKLRTYISTFVVMAVLVITPQAAKALTLEEAVAKIDAMISEMTLLKSQLKNLTDTVVTTSQSTVTPSGNILTMDLSYGATNEDIAKIQRLLATDVDIYPYGVDSGFFGPKTQDAIRLFQSRFDLDTVGVVGPSTKAILELFMAAYPDENYPADVLKKVVPTTQTTASNSVVTTPSTPATSNTTSGKSYSRITVDEDSDEFIIKSYFTNGERNRDLILYPENEDELIEMIAKKLSTSESSVRSLVDVDEDWFESKSSSSRGADEDDAEDAIDDADEALDRLRDLIEEAEDDDIDVDDAEDLYDEARDLLEEAEDALDDEDYDDAVDLAEEAEELADEAEDELDEAEEESEEIDVIEVTIREDDSKVVVEYENGDDEKFTVDETDEDDIIEEIADELDIDEDDVEDLIEFDYGDIERVDIIITDDETKVRIYFESGHDIKYVTDEDDEDDIIEEVADEFDLDEDDVERFADVDDQR